MLAIATEKDYDEGFFVFLFPSLNEQCQQGVDKYKAQLANDNQEFSGFYPMSPEDFVNTLVEIDDAHWIRELRKRYLG